jgi:hypothetical protein
MVTPGYVEESIMNNECLIREIYQLPEPWILERDLLQGYMRSYEPVAVAAYLYEITQLTDGDCWACLGAEDKTYLAYRGDFVKGLPGALYRLVDPKHGRSTKCLFSEKDHRFLVQVDIETMQPGPKPLTTEEQAKEDRQAQLALQIFDDAEAAWSDAWDARVPMDRTAATCQLMWSEAGRFLIKEFGWHRAHFADRVDVCEAHIPHL